MISALLPKYLKYIGNFVHCEVGGLNHDLIIAAVCKIDQGEGGRALPVSKYLFTFTMANLGSSFAQLPWDDSHHITEIN